MSVETQMQPRLHATPSLSTPNGQYHGTLAHAHAQTSTSTSSTPAPPEERERVLSSSAWSKLGKNYNVNAGPQAATQFIHVEYMDSIVFPRIDAFLAAHAASPSQDKLRILNLAAGTGAELELTLQRYWAGQDDATKERVKAGLEIVVSDAAEGMLDVAKTVIERHGAHDVAKAQIVDAQNVAFADASFDVLLLFYGPNILPDASQAFREAYRVLKPSGLALFATPSNLLIWDVCNEARTAVLQRRASPPANTHENMFRDSRMLKGWCDLSWAAKVREAGFPSAGVHAQVTRAAQLQDDYEETFDHFFTQPQYQMLLADLDDGEKKEMRAEVSKICSSRNGEGGLQGRQVEAWVETCVVAAAKA